MAKKKQRYAYRVGLRIKGQQTRYRYMRTHFGARRYFDRVAKWDAEMKAKPYMPYARYLEWGPVLERQPIGAFETMVYTAAAPIPTPPPPKPKPKKVKAKVGKVTTTGMTVASTSALIKSLYIPFDPVEPEPPKPDPPRIWLDKDGRVTMDEAEGVEEIEVELSDTVTTTTMWEE